MCTPVQIPSPASLTVLCGRTLRQLQEPDELAVGPSGRKKVRELNTKLRTGEPRELRPLSSVQQQKGLLTGISRVADNRSAGQSFHATIGPM
jgi:hypothetical protein